MPETKIPQLIFALSVVDIEETRRFSRKRALALRRMPLLLKSLRNLVLILFPGSEFASFASVILVRLVQSDANAVDVRIVEGDENPRLGDFSLLKVLQYECEASDVLRRVAGLNMALNLAINLR